MSYPLRILVLSLVKPFYKENAGGFVFVFIMLFCIVNKVDGAELFDYHLSLATGMLKSGVFLALVFAIWLLYWRKATHFVSSAIKNPTFGFLQLYNQLALRTRVALMLVVNVLLMLPVVLYVVFVLFVGLKQHLYLPLVLIVLYLLILCIMAAALHAHQTNFLNNRLYFASPNSFLIRLSSSNYVGLLLGYVFTKQFPLWLGIKIFTCGLLYLVARNYTPNNSDVSMAFLLYNFGILANAALILRVRQFEETELDFYRSLPVTRFIRLVQYLIIYTVCLLPEFATLAGLARAHLSWLNMLHFMLCGLGLLLLMHSITFLENFKMKAYIHVLLAIFCLEAILLMAMGFIFLYAVLFVLAIAIFFRHYYRFERTV